MKFYKDNSNKVYAFEAEGSQDDYIGEHLIPITEAEAMAITNPPPTPDQLAASIRAERDRKIADVTWRYERIARQERLGISPTDNITALDAYVQALADITLQATFPQSVTWPEVPA